MNKNSRSKSTLSTKGGPGGYRKRGGIYKTDEGTFRARKCWNGVKVSRTFKRKRDAQEWLTRGAAIAIAMTIKNS